MQLHPKKRIEIVVEASCASKILEMIEATGAKGYTLLNEVSGKGHRGVRNDSHLTDVFRNVLIIVIAAESIALEIIRKSQPLLENYAGIVTVSDVEVVRNEHF
jgi:nitrogen regulatory protein PII